MQSIFNPFAYFSSRSKQFKVTKSAKKRKATRGEKRRKIRYTKKYCKKHHKRNCTHRRH